MKRFCWISVCAAIVAAALQTGCNATSSAAVSDAADMSPDDGASDGTSPDDESPDGAPPDNAPPADGPAASGDFGIEQTLSDEAQRNTIAFDGLALLTGDLCSDSFLPPGKVADFSGFQYLRDNDPTNLGHNTDFVTIIAFNMLNILNDSQLAVLVTLAESQIDLINQHGYERFPLMLAFRRLLEGDTPDGSDGTLDENAVKEYSAELYRLDGQISFQRAEVLGGILRSLTADQQAELDALTELGGVDNWDKTLANPLVGLPLSQDENVAVMTYASEMYSWYAGSVEADTYFCPERQGTYFGSFYMKDMPAMGNPDFTIDSNLTADMGSAFLDVLTDTQAELVTSLVDLQRDALNEIVETRRAISAELRRFMEEASIDEEIVLALAEEYGELDGEIVYLYATHFAEVGQTLTDQQLAQLTALREEWNTIPCAGAYLYSESIALPQVSNSDYLFGVGDWPSVVPQGSGGGHDSPEYDACIDNTRDDAACKDCCDCLDADGETRKACRDSCPTHDFSLNTDFITVDAPSTLGPEGDYSACVEAGSEQACKECCDASSEFECGDRRFCRDACNAADPGDDPPASDQAGIVAPGAAITLLADGFSFAEGPAADQSGHLYFSDIASDRIYKWSADGELTVYLEDSAGANGLFFDLDDSLLACAGGSGSIVAIEAPGEQTLLAGEYDGQPFNEPNDLWVAPDGGIYFSDPAYDAPVVQDGEHVYYIPPDRGDVIRIIDDLVRPNGIIGTADGQTLYVTDHGAKQTYQYDIQEDGSVSNKRLFASVGADGLTIDDRGNVYMAADGVLVYDPAGSHIEAIDIPEATTNACFGGADGHTLFVTTRTSVYSLRMTAGGL